MFSDLPEALADLFQVPSSWEVGAEYLEKAPRCSYCNAPRYRHESPFCSQTCEEGNRKKLLARQDKRTAAGVGRRTCGCGKRGRHKKSCPLNPNHPKGRPE